MKINRGILFKKMLAVMTVAVITAAVGLLGLLPAFADHGASATRSFKPATVAPSGEVEVTIAAAHYGRLGRVTETLPAGFSYESSSLTHDEDVQVDGQTVKFTLLGRDETFTYTVTASSTAGPYDFSGVLRDDLLNNHEVGGDSSVTVGATEATGGRVQTLQLTNSPNDPGAVAQYTFTFMTPAALMANEDSITLHFDKDIKNTGQLSGSDIRISATLGTQDPPAPVPATSPASPTRSVIQGATNNDNVEYIITVPDMDPTDEGVGGIGAGATVTITVLSSAGFTNPTEAGGGDKVGVYTSEDVILQTTTFKVPLVLTLSDYNGNRNKAVTVTGKGFKNGTTADVWLDADGNGEKDTGEITLVNAVPVGSTDTFETSVTVTVPPFEVQGAGTNYINAVDGESNSMGMGQGAGNMPPTFKVDGLMTVSPRSAGIGDEITLDFDDWPTGEVSSTLTIGGVPHTLGIGGRVEIMSNVPLGTQVVHYKSLKADGSTLEDDTQNIVITGADVDITPRTVVPNQTVTIIGRGFTGGTTISSILIGSETIPANRINNGLTVNVDTGGNWSASVVIPINNTSVEPNAAHQIRVDDSMGRGGIGMVAIPERTLTVEPATGRPGTQVTVTGTGFPATNSAGDVAPSVEITYDGKRGANVNTDASGSFVASFRVPLNQTIPSTNNEVKADFEVGAVSGDATASHSVPEGIITLSSNEGKAGDTITVTGEGFKAFNTLKTIEIGIVEVTPSPKPPTGVDGSFTTQFLVPQLELGTHTVKADVGGTVASAVFKIVETSAASTTMMMEAEAATPDVAFAAVIAEDNLIAVYHFDPATQNEAPNYGYTVYDARPLFMSGNNLDSIEPGQFYTVEVSENQMGVTLGNQTVDLYAAFTPIRW